MTKHSGIPGPLDGSSFTRNGSVAIVERGILPTVSKTHFTPLKKNVPPKKTRWWLRNSNESVFFVDTGSTRAGSRDGPVDRAKRPSFYARKVNIRRNRRGAFLSFSKFKKRLCVKTSERRKIPTLTESLRYESLRFASYDASPAASVESAPTATFSLQFQISFCCSWTLVELVLHPFHRRPARGDLHDLLLLCSARITRSIILERRRHFGQSGYCEIVRETE